ncbi:MAG: YggS family pyridoxal phosphate-dependent enzyme [Planctomycetota bacterium]|nr:YggS family pyridoxal phosphate-dependent enzyme [Planctomycetota bacterium]
MSPPPDPLLAILRANLAGLDARIEAARVRSPHGASAVERIVVTKSQPAAIYGPLAAVGVRAVAENRVQAAVARRPGAPADLVWHGIGHLQRNKARGALEAFDVFHALDGLALAGRLQDLLAATGRTWPVYLQVHASEDPAKGGFDPEEVPAALQELVSYPSLQILGFMTMAAEAAQESELRRTFRTLRDVRDDAVARGVGTTPPAGLSMGMSADFELAVEEGATAVRVGRAVFDGIPSTTREPT